MRLALLLILLSASIPPALVGYYRARSSIGSELQDQYAAGYIRGRAVGSSR